MGCQDQVGAIDGTAGTVVFATVSQASPASPGLPRKGCWRTGHPPVLGDISALNLRKSALVLPVFPLFPPAWCMPRPSAACAWLFPSGLGARRRPPHAVPVASGNPVHAGWGDDWCRGVGKPNPSWIRPSSAGLMRSGCKGRRRRRLTTDTVGPVRSAGYLVGRAREH